jgi:flavin reductase (DIM6/NTAB) family NADH-FMN oxidoreductase RutF
MTNDPLESLSRLLNRELWIVTAADGARRGGLVATGVFVASIDARRPVLVAGLSPNHFTTELVQTSRAFAAHLLRPDQIDLAWNFAKDSGRNRDKLAGLSLTNAKTGSPILADCLASFECRVFARHDTGDRLYFWADVVEAATPFTSADQPLREQEFVKQLTDAQRQQLLASRRADTEILRPLHEAWRKTVAW